MKKVLIVDDAAFMRKSLRRILEKNNFCVVGEAQNGEEAIIKYKELRPDLVTMDITMPKVSGIEAVSKIKELDPKAKIVMVSAMGQEAFLRESIKNGAKSFIVKPFNEQHIIKTLTQILFM